MFLKQSKTNIETFEIEKTKTSKQYTIKNYQKTYLSIKCSYKLGYLLAWVKGNLAFLSQFKILNNFK